MQILILTLAVLRFALSVVGTEAVKRLALRVGLVDKPGGRKIHDQPKALGGGIAIYLAIAIPMISGLLILNLVDLRPGTGGGTFDPALSALAVHLPGIRQQTPLAIGLLVAMTCIHLMGLWDDRRALGPYTKLGVQLLVAGAAADRVRIAIYDVRGSLVRRLVDQAMPAGEHRATWNGVDDQGRPASSGIYFVRMIAGSHTETRKIVMLK